MELIVALAIAGATALFITLPFLRGTGGGESVSAGETERAERLREVLAEKETLYAAIQEMDFDHQSGKLSREDHGSLRQEYEQQAAHLLMRIDALTAESREPSGAERGQTARAKRRRS